MSERSVSQTLPWTEARFRGRVLRRSSRDVIVDGQAQRLEPRTFDVLVHLIDHRYRVLGKADILRDCLHGTATSEGALARTIMKIRRAICDFDTRSPIIKTIHRVGYRFVAVVEDEAVASEHGEGPLQAGSSFQYRVTGGGRVAILPFHNQTGRADLA